VSARTLVLGGGFGGIAAAVELRRLLGDDHEIVLVDRQPQFVMGALWKRPACRRCSSRSRRSRPYGARGVHDRHRHPGAVAACKGSHLQGAQAPPAGLSGAAGARAPQGGYAG
jgi:cation diffusion facilitator CzcD-associated flavoprotein CzcO